MLLAGSLCACGSSFPDTGPDSGSADAGDAGAPPGSDAGDGGGSDAGGSDAGSADAGSNDAGSADAGSNDAGAPDAGNGDGGVITSSLQLFVTPNPTGHTQVIDAINSAAHSVHLVMYHLTEPAVTQALINAHARGAAVEVILDQSSLTTSEYSDSYNELRDAGVDVIKSSTGFSITHEKSMTIDGNEALITSMNMTKTYATTRDYGVSLSDPSVIAEWESVFAADLNNAVDGGTYTPAVSKLVWSPTNSSDELAALVASATHTLDTTVETIHSSTAVFTALQAAAQRGVAVRLLTPECVESSTPTTNYSSLSTLVSAGVSARLMPNPSTASAPYMHGKMMLVDSERAFVGSENFTADSLEDARECGIIFDDPAAVATLGTTVTADWAASIAIPATPPTNCPAD